MNTVLASLCNLCDEYGHSNFDTTCELIQEIASLGGGETTTDPACLTKQTRNHETFLKRKFPKLGEALFLLGTLFDTRLRSSE